MHTFLFDFDGTLVDSMPTYGSVMKGILDEHHIPYGDDLIKIITPLGFVYTAKYFIDLGVPVPEETLIAQMKERMIEAYSTRVPAKFNVPEVLRALKSKGCSLNVLTASPHDTLDPCLKRLGLWELFDNVWSCNDFGTSKSDPEIYRMAAQRIGVPVGEVIFLDDNLGADTTAKSAGTQVWGVYDDSSRDSTEEIKAVSDHYINNFIEILDLI